MTSGLTLCLDSMVQHCGQFLTPLCHHLASKMFLYLVYKFAVVWEMWGFFGGGELDTLPLYFSEHRRAANNFSLEASVAVADIGPILPFIWVGRGLARPICGPVSFLCSFRCGSRFEIYAKSTQHFLKIPDVPTDLSMLVTPAKDLTLQILCCRKWKSFWSEI